MHSKNLDQPSLELQLENRACTSLSNEIMEKTRELRQMKGEELQGLNMEELKKPEELLEEGLSRVLKAKDERFLEEMSALERKVSQLMEDNQQLKQMDKQFNIKTHAIEQGQSSESITNICSSADPLQDQDNNDTSLKLGTGPRLELKASKEPPGLTQQLDNSRLESLAETENVCDFFEDLKHRFLRFKKRKFKENLEHFQNLAQGQPPKFMIIACADSRVCPTNILGFQPGEVFVVRNIANLVPTFESGPSETNAALEFAVNALKVENILVIGHSRCGGIRALMSMQDEEDSSSFIRSWVVVGNNARLITKSAASNLSFDQQCVQTLRRNQSTIPCQICSLTHG
ncbi:beta carbonic anhydrase 5, chloroplastic-like [Corylus avellana]|uniref:beta carbonic anhydrase 5, chloroplastic-like n=1 Tax=Corylus avellana TaxID=13451 RepID=UPI00286CE3C8|nr:beta carbonic anhydrase 5, chloroplastic-like [Corylus avellana]